MVLTSTPGHFPRDFGGLEYLHIRGRTSKINIPEQYWGTLWKRNTETWLGVTSWTDNGAVLFIPSARGFMLID